MSNSPSPRRRSKPSPAESTGDTYNLDGDFRGAVINIQSTIVSEKEAVELESLPAEPGDAPYLGLQYFDEDDADRFFGREGLTARLVNRLKSARFLAVIGDSGSGKSSLVRAGVIPALRRGRRLADDSLPPTDSPQWDIRTFTPTAHPLDALAGALTRESASPTALAELSREMSANPRGLSLAARQLLARQSQPRLLLVIDQFEEVFSQCHQEDERAAFLDNLLAACDPTDEQPVSLLILLRADFYARLAQFDRLREMVSQQQEFIGAMSREELFEAIVKPAALGNWKIQQGLVDVMLDDIGAEPGALPLLSHALLETWNRRRQRTMTLSGYSEAGGVRGAIARTAEAVFQKQLDPNQRQIARMIFLRLAELGADAQDTRRRAHFSELITRATDPLTIEAVLSILIDARLVTTGIVEPGAVKTVEVAHEALIREWPTLRDWLEKDREGLILHRQLTDDTAGWLRLEKDPGALYRGLRLQQAAAWAEANAGELSLDEQAFLDASRQAQADDEARERRYRQGALMRRVVLPAAGVVGVGVLVALFFLTGLNVRFKTPARMNGVFNVAVAEFGAAGANGTPADAPGEGGLTLSGWVGNQLRSELADDPNLLVWQDGPALRRENVRIGRVEGSSAQDKAAAAQAMAERLNAHMLVFGNIDTTQQPARLQLEFWLAPQLDYHFDVGQDGYQTGSAIVLRDPANPSIEVQPEINRQASTLAWVALGLTRMRFGQTSQALEAFQQAAVFSPESASVQFFVGRESLFLSDSDAARQEELTAAAEAAFRAAIERDPAYGNAYIGLGSTYFASAKRLVSPEGPLEVAQGLVEQALAAYRSAEELPEQNEESGTPVRSIARLGTGTALRLLAEIQYLQGRVGDAGISAQQAVETLAGLVAAFQTPGSERYLAQTYQTLATAYQWLATIHASQSLFEQSQQAYQQALDSYARCIELGEGSADQIVKVDIVEQLCVPEREALEQFLGSGGGG